MAEHSLTLKAPLVGGSWRGDKNFELLKDDRKFSIGDTLHIEETDGMYFTGVVYQSVVNSIVTGEKWGVRPGYHIVTLEYKDKSFKADRIRPVSKSAN